MTNQAPTKKPLPPRFVPIDRKKTAPRDVVTHLCRFEAYKLMKFDRRAGAEWNGMEITASTRYLKALTHGETLDYSALKIHQIVALQTIFMYVCFFEQNRSLGPNTCLPGMVKDWYNVLFVEAVNDCTRTLRRAERKLEEDKKQRKMPRHMKLNLDDVMGSAISHWRNTVHLPEIELRLSENADANPSESTEEDAAARLDRNPETKQRIAEAQSNLDNAVELDMSNVINLFEPQAAS